MMLQKRLLFKKLKFLTRDLNNWLDIKALEENGFPENTLVIFTAYNGTEKYDYDRFNDYNHKGASKLHGLKRNTREKRSVAERN